MRAATEERRDSVEELFNAGRSDTEIADALGVQLHTVRSDRRHLGLRRRRGRQPGAETLSQKKERSAQEKARDLDRRRFKTTPVPSGQPTFVMPADAAGPRFPNKVKTPDGSECVLKDGANSSKIGGDVLVGQLKGAHIVTLSLPERTTCPRSCKQWRICYGNAMQWATRWEPGPELENLICLEIDDLCRNREKVLVRLHVLGDFYSEEYVKMWADLLDKHDNLFIFGFTAHQPHTRIGRMIKWLRENAPEHFAVRTSDNTGKWGSFTVDWLPGKGVLGDAIVCPEQRYARLPSTEAKQKMAGKRGSLHCGNCGICWSTDRPVAFLVH